MGKLDIGCSGYDHRETFRQCGGACYRLATNDDGSSVAYDAGGRTAWCIAEQHLTIAEKLPSLEQLVAELDDLERHGADVLDEVTGSVRSPARQLHDAREVIAWQRQRTTPERCLGCGSTNLVDGGDLWDEKTKIPHPGCTANGQLVVLSATLVGEMGSRGQAIGPDGLLLSPAPSIFSG